MTFWMSVVWGIVFAFAELIPCSGDTFLNALSNYFAFCPYDSEVNIVYFFLMTGLALACIAVFLPELRMFLYGLLHSNRKHPTPNEKISKRMFSLLLFSLLPMLLAVLIRKRLTGLENRMIWLSVATVLNGALVLVASKYNKGSKTDKTITIGDAVFVGISQVFSVVPGFSRTGVTLLAAMTSGFESDFALQYSVMLGIPVYLCMAFGYFVAGIGGFVLSHILLYILAAVFAAVSGYGTLKLLRWLLAKSYLDAAAFFCFGAGTVMLVLSFIN